MISAVQALSGLWVLSLAMEGWYRGRLPSLQRFGLLIGAIGLLLPPNIMLAGIPSYYFCFAGLVISCVFVMQRRIQTVGYST
jgi:hypothetical protein